MSTSTTEPVDVASRQPAHAPAVLAALVLAATVANLNLAVANTALPDIGTAFDASQTQLNLVALGYSLGLAASVLYLGAVGDRFGRRRMLLAGTALAVPASLLAAWAPSVQVLIVARLLGGVAAGMAVPTTLALITALWSGPARTRSIALWSAVGGAMAAVGPLVAGFLLGDFWWGSVFLVTIPLAVVSLALTARLVPAHVNETTEAVDHLGGVLSVIAVATLVVSISLAPERGQSSTAAALALVAVAATAAFVLRQRRAPNPLFDLHVAARRTFWVAAVGGMVVFGSLMGAMFVGQQYLQNVLGYSTLEAGAAIVPGAVMMILVAPHSARLVEHHGARTTLLLGYLCCFAGFVAMLVLWDDTTPWWGVLVPYGLVGAGVGLAGTPASRSLTSSVPVRRAGMASGTADLQRDLGGAILQSVLGTLLTAGDAVAFAGAIRSSPAADSVSDTTRTQLLRSFSSAEATARRYPDHADQITTAAREAFTRGQNWAYLAGAIAVALGALLVAVAFPRRDEEQRLLAGYAAADRADEPD